MLFVIGGAYQGKLAYVKERFHLEDSDIFHCTEDKPLDLSKRCIYHYERYVAYAVRKGETPVCRFSASQIVIMDDLSCGVVPIDPEIRAYREEAGRAGCAVTRNADEVIRVFCGIPKTIKAKRTKIYLIRHGLTQAAIERFYCGNTDLPLTEQGKEELLRKKEILSYPDAAGKKIYTSALLRTKQTAELLFPGAPLNRLAAFNEMNFGSFEGRTYDGDLESDPDFVLWVAGSNERNVCPFGESSLMMQRRVLSAFEKILTAGEDCVIVSHGGPIAAIYSNYIPDSGLHFYQIQPKHGEGYCMEFEGSRLVRCTRLAEA